MQYAALHDPLTGLPNRTLLGDRLGHVFRRATAGIRVGLCFIDVDDFKSVNDSLGHRVGDHLIAAVAERLGGLARQSGHFLARLSGDKFALLVEDTFCADDAVKVADQALATFTEPFHIDDHALPIRASAGRHDREPADAHRGTCHSHRCPDARLTVPDAASLIVLVSAELFQILSNPVQMRRSAGEHPQPGTCGLRVSPG